MRKEQNIDVFLIDIIAECKKCGKSIPLMRRMLPTVRVQFDVKTLLALECAECKTSGWMLIVEPSRDRNEDEDEDDYTQVRAW